MSEASTSTLQPRRVPEPDALFWLLKLLTTGVGEVASDFLVRTFDPVPVVLLAVAGFAGVAVVQLSARRYVPWRYWAFVLAVAVFGTMIADVTHIVVGVPYAVSTPVFAMVLVAVFIWWHRSQGTLSVHSIDTRPRELFYWATVIATFALGTAFGDLTATTLGLGYLGSAILFAGLFVVPAILYRLGLSAVIAFWWAYVLTRPLGASIADWLAVAPTRGGLDIGYAWITGVGVGLIALGVAAWQVREWRRVAPG